MIEEVLSMGLVFILGTALVAIGSWDFYVFFINKKSKIRFAIFTGSDADKDRHYMLMSGALFILAGLAALGPLIYSIFYE